MEEKTGGKKVLWFFVGLLLGTGGTYLALTPHNPLTIATNTENLNQDQGGLISQTPQALIDETKLPTGTDHEGWDGLLGEINKTVKPFFEAKKVLAGEFTVNNISQTTDLTGDDVAEALITTKTTGVNLQYATILQRKDNVVSIAKIKNQKGTTENFITPIGLSGNEEIGVKFLPEDRSFYVSSIKRDSGGTATACSFSFYHWNEVTTIFEYNKALSEVAHQNNCE